jgi:hypothetical protein
MVPAVELHLYGRAQVLFPGLTREMPNGVLPTLHCPDLAKEHMDLSFDTAVEALSQLERMHIEMDGSFVWRGQLASADWQIDGMLYDRQNYLQRVELKTTPAALHTWYQLLSALGWPVQPMIAHLLVEQCFTGIDDWLALFDS